MPKPQNTTTRLIVYAPLWACVSLALLPISHAQTSPTVETVVVQADETSSSESAADTVNESPRERGRVLLKRNPIASEYAGAGTLGLAPGAGSDAEGVDYRGYFPLPSIDDVKEQTRVEVGFNFQGEAQKVTPQAALSSAVLLGEGATSLQVSARRSTSNRTIEHYQSAWTQRVFDGAEADFYLQRARYSQDFYDTTNDQLRWSLEHRLSDQLRIGYEGLFNQYDDEFYRNRMEHRFIGGTVLSETITPDGVSQLELQDASIRRYFGDTVTERQWHRHMLDLEWETDHQSLTVSGYYGEWNTKPTTNGWNFYDREIDLGYDLSDPYAPVISVLDGTDLQDTSAAVFSDFQIYNTDTTDTDYAARIDFDQRLDMGNQVIWISTGLLHRSKERVNDYAQEVYGAGTNSFFLDAVDKDAPAGMIVQGAYDLPRGIDPDRGLDYFEQNKATDFAFNESVSILSSARSRYTTEETVESAYFLAYQRIGDWRWEVGLRQEWTKTDTKGIITGDFDNLDQLEGDFLEMITVAGIDYDVSNGVGSTYIKEAVGGNSYDHLLPSISLSYDPDKNWAWRAAYYQLMMRPQYFDIVNYRRIQHPTTGISEGNPELAPTLIDNFVTAVDWESDIFGQWSVELYYMKITDFYYGTSEFEDVFNPLSGNVEQYTVSTIENGDSAWIQGFQLQWSDEWSDILPGLDSLRVTAAYTFSDSEATFEQLDENNVFVEEKTQLPERARHLLNVNLTAKVDRWTYNTRISYLSSTLDDLGDSRERDEFRGEVIAWDNSIAYKHSDRWLASLALSNILNHPERSYEGVELRAGDNQYSSYILKGSIQATF